MDSCQVPHQIKPAKTDAGDACWTCDFTKLLPGGNGSIPCQAKELKDLNLDVNPTPMKRSLGASWDLKKDVSTLREAESTKLFTHRGVQLPSTASLIHLDFLQLWPYRERSCLQTKPQIGSLLFLQKGKMSGMLRGLLFKASGTWKSQVHCCYNFNGHKKRATCIHKCFSKGYYSHRLCSSHWCWTKMSCRICPWKGKVNSPVGSHYPKIQAGSCRAGCGSRWVSHKWAVAWMLLSSTQIAEFS